MLKLIVEVSGDEVERVLDMLGAILEEDLEDEVPEEDVLPVSIDELMEFVKHKHSCCGKCHKNDD